MSELLDLSTKIIDSGHADQPVNRVTNQLTELADDLAIVESFSHSLVWNSGEGLVCFDTSGASTGNAIVEQIRTWSPQQFHSLIYPHGHLDHVGGSGAFAEDANKNSQPLPQVIAHKKRCSPF